MNERPSLCALPDPYYADDFVTPDQGLRSTLYDPRAAADA